MRMLVLSSIALLLLLAPGHPLQADAAGRTIIKVATVAPRSPTSVRRSKKFNQKLEDATNGRVQFRTYWGGAAGDDRTVLRKIRAGQVDASPFGVDMVTHFVRQAAVLGAPRTFYNYKQVDAVREEITPAFDQEAYKNGYKILTWWDFGKVRIFSRDKVQTIAQLRQSRPWLYPESPLLKAFYKMNDVTGVPLGIGEVYGGLQTGMINTVWISAIGAMALRWHTKTEYISPPVGFIQGAFVISRVTWDKLSEQDQQALERITAENQRDFQREIREQDHKTYKKLLSRGLKLAKFSKTSEWVESGKKLRRMMVGRIYDKELLSRVETIAAKYGDESSDILR